MAVSTDIPLNAGEKVLWTGAPPKGFMLRGADLLMVPFSLVWAGFIVAMFRGTAHGAQNGPPIFLIPFLAVAIYITVGRFVLDAWVRGRTAYVVTNQRVVIVSGAFDRSIKSLNLRTLTDVTLSERGSGRGTITFGAGAGAWVTWANASMRWPGAPQVPVFERIANAREVYELIDRAQQEGAAPARVAAQQ